jgi:hypothetical protein
MLSFDTVHAITDHLYLADAAHRADRLHTDPRSIHRLDATATLFLLQQPPPPAARRVRGAAIALTVMDPYTALPQHLHHLAHVLTSAPTTSGGVVRRTPMLAVAVRYTDVTVYTDTVTVDHRIDAVDTDGRTYRLTRHPGDITPFLIVDDVPNQAGLPPVYSGLSAVLAAAARRSVQPSTIR